jgi:hypothetical protein
MRYIAKQYTTCGTLSLDDLRMTVNHADRSDTRRTQSGKVTRLDRLMRRDSTNYQRSGDHNFDRRSWNPITDK